MRVLKMENKQKHIGGHDSNYKSNEPRKPKSSSSSKVRQRSWSTGKPSKNSGMFF